MSVGKTISYAYSWNKYIYLFRFARKFSFFGLILTFGNADLYKMKEKIYNALPYLVLLSGLLVTFLFFRTEQLRQKVEQETYFQEQTDKIRQNILYRLQTYVDEQIAAAAFVSSSDVVKRREWRKFVAALELDLNYPGIYGLGFAVPVQKKDSLLFIREIKADEPIDFKITGMGQVPEATDLYIIKFLEPQSRNKQALGFDMGSEPVRRKAMEAARNTKEPSISDRVILVQDQGRKPGFLIYVPVFKTFGVSDTAKARFIGWTYSPFIAENFMRGVLQRELNYQNRSYEVELYDGETPEASQLLYHTSNPDAANFEKPFQVTFPVYGTAWTLRILPIAGFSSSEKPALPYVILIGGILLNISLFFLILTLANTRRNAISLAEKMTGELRTLNQSLDKKVEERTRELAEKNKQLSNYSENLKNAYEDLEVKVKFRNLQLEKQVKALQEENTRLKNNKA